MALNYFCLSALNLCEKLTTGTFQISPVEFLQNSFIGIKQDEYEELGQFMTSQNVYLQFPPKLQCF